MKLTLCSIMVLCCSLFTIHCSEYKKARRSLLTVLPCLHEQKVQFTQEHNSKEIKHLAAQISSYATASKTIMKTLKTHTYLDTAQCFMHCPDLADAVCQSILDAGKLFVSCNGNNQINQLIPLTINATSFPVRLRILQTLLQSYDANCFGQISDFFSRINRWHGNRLLLPFAFLKAQEENNDAKQFVEDIRLINNFYWKDYSFSLITDESLHTQIFDGLDTIEISKTKLPIVENLMRYKGDVPQKNPLLVYKDHVCKIHKARKKIKKLMRDNLKKHTYPCEMKRRLVSALQTMDL